MRSLINSLVETCQIIPPSFVEKISDEDFTITELVIYDVSMFIFWLSTIDGNLSENELSLINDCFPNAYKPLAKGDILHQLIENDCFGPAFLTAQPSCLRFLVEADNNLYMQNPATENLCDIFYNTFRNLGERIVCTDNFSPIKQKWLSDFLFMIGSYMNRHSVRP